MSIPNLCKLLLFLCAFVSGSFECGWPKTSHLMFIPRKHANSLKKVKLRCRTVTLGGAGHHIHAHAYTDIIYYQ